MVTLLNSLPEWVLALLGVLLLLIAALYVWILFNWLALRQRVFELAEQNERLAQAVAAQPSTERLYEAPRPEALAFVSPSATELDEAREAEREATKAAVRNLQNQINVAHSQLANANRAVQLRQVALDEAHRRLITYEGAIADLQASLQQARTVPVALAMMPVEQAELTRVDEVDDVTTDTVVVDHDAVDDTTPTNDTAALASQLNAATSLIEARDAQVDNLEAQLAELQTQMDQARDEIARADVRFDEQQLTQDNAGLVDAPASTTPIVPLQEAGVALLAAKALTSAHVAHEQDALALTQEAVQSRDATIGELKTQLGNVRTSLEMAREALQARDMELAQLKAQPADLEQPLTELQHKLDEHEQTMTTTNMVLAERISTISDLNHELDEQETQLAEVQLELAAKDARLNDVLTQLDAQNATISDLLSDVNAANETVALQQSRFDNLSTQLTDLQTAADAPAVSAEREAEFEAQKQGLEQQLQGAQAAYTELDAQLDALRTRVVELEAQLQQSQTEAEAANAKLTSRAKRIETLKAQVEAAQAELAAQAGRTTRSEFTSRESLPTPSDSPAETRPNGLDELSVPVPVRTAGKRKAAVEPVAETPSDEDALIDIVGIGAVYAKRLSKAGITTYKALAKAKRSQLEKIIQPSKLQNIDFDDWIEQAKSKAKAGKR